MHLQKGKSYSTLKPTYAIWILANNLKDFEPNTNDYIHNYQVQDSDGNLLVNHCGIWVVD